MTVSVVDATVRQLNRCFLRTLFVGQTVDAAHACDVESIQRNTVEHQCQSSRSRTCWFNLL